MCRGGYRINTSFARRVREPICVLLLGKGESASSGTDLHSDPSAFVNIEAFGLDAGIGQSFAGSIESEGNRAGNMLSVLWVDLGLPVKVRHLGRDLNLEPRGVEGCDTARAADTGSEPIPIGVFSNSDRRDTAETGNNDTARFGLTRDYILLPVATRGDGERNIP